MSETASGFSTAIVALSRAGVSFVLVGVGGINFYARDPDHAFSTLDVHVVLAPEASNLRLALLTLSDLGFSFEAGGEPFLDLEDEVALASVIRLGTSLSARHPRETQLDLMLSIAGFSYEEIAHDAARFNVEGAEVDVGRLEKLLRSKELSGRPKDIEFLRAFSARVVPGDEEGET